MAEAFRSAPSAHVDTFCRDHLPPRHLWPRMEWNGLPEPDYPPELNAVAELLDAHIAVGRGARPLFYSEGELWTYRRVFETANHIAHVLVEDLGVVPGNRILLRSPNNAMLAACWFAVLKAGAVAVSTMPLLRARELESVVQKADLKLALTDARFAADLEEVMASRSNSRVVRFDDLLRNLPDAPGARTLEFKNCPTSAEDVAILAFTSGSTGRPKGTMHFHRDLLAVADTFGRHVLQANAGDIFMGSPPLAFTYALGGLILFPMRCGASTVLVEQTSPPLLLKAIHDQRPTVLFTSPTAYRVMLPLLKEFDITCLRKCVSAGEHLPKATYESWLKATGIRIIDGIGSTELLHIFVSSPDSETRAGSTGRVVPGYCAGVLDENGNELPRGQVGRLAVRGPTGCRYLDAPEEQSKYVQNGWNMTADAYVLDEQGYFWYHSRTDDMIISSGYNISAPEVENALLDHPAVAECAVIGVPDENRGHIVKAFVVPARGAEPGEKLVCELQDFVKSVIAPYKYPRSIEFVSFLPRTQTGKLQRYVLRQSSTVAETIGMEGTKRPGNLGSNS